MSSNAVKLNASSAKQGDLNDQIETLRADLSALTQTIAELGKARGDEAVAATLSKVSQARDIATEQVDAARKQAVELQGQANDMIRQNPAAALGIAAGLGFLLGFMGGRK